MNTWAVQRCRAWLLEWPARLVICVRLAEVPPGCPACWAPRDPPGAAAACDDLATLGVAVRGIAQGRPGHRAGVWPGRRPSAPDGCRHPPTSRSTSWSIALGVIMVGAALAERRRRPGRWSGGVRRHTDRLCDCGCAVRHQHHADFDSSAGGDGADTTVVWRSASGHLGRDRMRSPLSGYLLPDNASARATARSFVAPPTVPQPSPGHLKNLRNRKLFETTRTMRTPCTTATRG